MLHVQKIIHVTIVPKIVSVIHSSIGGALAYGASDLSLIPASGGNFRICFAGVNSGVLNPERMVVTAKRKP